MTDRERIAHYTQHRSEHRDDDNCEICFLVKVY